VLAPFSLSAPYRLASFFVGSITITAPHPVAAPIFQLSSLFPTAAAPAPFSLSTPCRPTSSYAGSVTIAAPALNSQPRTSRCSLPLSLPSPTPSWETPLLPSFAIVVANALPSFTYTATSGTYHHHQFRSHSQVTFYIDSTTFQPWTLVNP
ncbi:hypothetical protein BHE74_00054829, partial [Ensete ventricosum]